MSGSEPVVVAVVVDGPLTAQAEQQVLRGAGWHHNAAAGEVGAALRFEGIVRRTEPDGAGGGVRRELLALNYQTYDPMAQRQLLALGNEMVRRHDLSALVVLHSRGRVAVGEVSFILIVESAHRAEALTAMGHFIDGLKRDVPIWKQAAWR